jgi:hypothetical protein
VQFISQLFRFAVSPQDQAVFSMNSSATSMSDGVLLPNYPLASRALLHAIEQLGLVSPMSTDDDGEYRNLHRTGLGLGKE